MVIFIASPTARKIYLSNEGEPDFVNGTTTNIPIKQFQIREERQIPLKILLIKARERALFYDV